MFRSPVVWALSAQEAMKFRIAEPKDLPELADMRLAHKAEEGSYSENSGEFKENFIESIGQRLNTDLVIFIVEADNSLVSCAYGVIVNKIPKPSSVASKFLYLTGVYCYPKFRGGVGSILINNIEQWSHLNNFEFVVTWPSERSKNLYSRLGYKTSESYELEISGYST